MILTLKDEVDTPPISGTIIDQNDVSAQFSAGLLLLFKKNTQFSFNVGYAGLDESEVESFSVGGR